VSRALIDRCGRVKPARSELHSHRLLQKLTRDGSPSFLHFPASAPVRNALEIGCGEGHWALYAAQAWQAHETTVIGIDVPLFTQEIQTKHTRWIAHNAELLCHNLCVYMTTRLHDCTSNSLLTTRLVLVSQSGFHIPITRLIMYA
jgi:tRNA G46 methylase TrmB